MNIKVERFKQTKECTFGRFYINDKLMCFTLEDVYREIKVYGKTRIPKGIYKIKLRTFGRIYEKQLERYGEDFYKGALWIKNVPNFDSILIHSGTTAEDTLGCILTASSYDEKTSTAFESRKAFESIYPLIRDALIRNEDVTIEILDLDK